MENNELRKLLLEREKMFERRKLKRAIYTILFYAAVYSLVFFWQGRFRSADIWDILSEVVIAIILSGITVLVNGIIFSQLVKVAKAEDEALEYIRKRIEKMDQENEGG